MTSWSLRGAPSPSRHHPAASQTPLTPSPRRSQAGRGSVMASGRDRGGSCPTASGASRLALRLAVAAPAVLGAWALRRDPSVFLPALRMFSDPSYLAEVLSRWDRLTPPAFVGLQAAQVVVAPLPGDVFGFLGGLRFGQWLGFVYSVTGQALGSFVAFWLGRQVGARCLRRIVNEQLWERMGFVGEAESAVLCFVIYPIPGPPKDVACYLSGMSPMPFRGFAVASSAGRTPGTWAQSARGATMADGSYVEPALVSALVAGMAVPLYYPRDRIGSWCRSRIKAQRSGKDTGRLEPLCRGPRAGALEGRNHNEKGGRPCSDIARVSPQW